MIEYSLQRDLSTAIRQTARLTASQVLKQSDDIVAITSPGIIGLNVALNYLPLPKSSTAVLTSVERVLLFISALVSATARA
jgi:hypothetical protein